VLQLPDNPVVDPDHAVGAAIVQGPRPGLTCRNQAWKGRHMGVRNVLAARVAVPAGTAIATSQHGLSGWWRAFRLLQAMGPGTTAPPDRARRGPAGGVDVVDFGGDLPDEAGGCEPTVSHAARAPQSGWKSTKIASARVWKSSTSRSAKGCWGRQISVIGSLASLLNLTPLGSSRYEAS
jgi:hypothetical protein